MEPDATVVENTIEPITLTIETGPNAGSFYPISSDTTIGRANDNDIGLNVKTVSGYHCKICIEDGQFILRDLDSTNGTKVNGTKACPNCESVTGLIYVEGCMTCQDCGFAKCG